MNLAESGWLEGVCLPCRLTSSNQCSHSKSHAPLGLHRQSHTVNEDRIPTVHSYVILCSWWCTSHLSLLVTILIKPEPGCVEGNPCSFPVDIPSHQEGLLKLLFPDIFPPIRIASRMAVNLCFAPFQMFPPCSALVLTGNCL